MVCLRVVASPFVSVALLLTLLAVTAVHSPAAAQSEPPKWPVKGKLIGKVKKGDVKKSKDVSGIACTSPSGFPRHCLVIDDELQSAQFVTLTDGKIVVGQPIRLIDDTLNGEALEFDGEGVAYADGYYYVIGSHGHPRDRKKKLHPIDDAADIRRMIAANSRVVRIAVDPATGQQVAGSAVRQSTLVTQLIAADKTLRPFLHQRLEKESNGVTIEGIAIRQGRLYIGFRGPSVNGNEAAILSAPLGAFFDGKALDKESLHLLPLGTGRGVRDLAGVDDGLLILAGPTANEDGTYSVYWWDGVSKNVTLLKDLARYTDEDGDQIKPEAFLPLDRSAAGLRLLVMFDGAKEGGPRAIVVNNPG